MTSAGDRHARPVRLVVVGDAVPRRADGQVLVSAKTRTGMVAYARHWPGPVSMLAREAAYDVSGNLGAHWTPVGALPFDLTVAADPVAAARQLDGPAVLLAGLDPRHAPLLAGPHPVVLGAENTPANQALWTELQLDRTTGLERTRIRAGARRRHLRQLAMVRRAAGLQANGWPVHEAYARQSRHPLLYLDSRVAADQVARARAVAPPPDGPLRLAFSGRLVPGKGVDHVVALAAELERRGVAATVEVIGAGPLEASLRAGAGDRVRFTAPMPYDPDWTSHVREHVDLMVLPHPQADPSGSYLEALGSGVPVLSYANAYARRLGEHSGGVATVAVGDVRALADRVSALAADRTALARLRDRGLAFMESHLFDDEFRRRCEHLRSALGRSGTEHGGPRA